MTSCNRPGATEARPERPADHTRAGRARRLGLAWCLALAACVGCDATLLDGLDEPQANDLIVALSAAGIDADKHGRSGRFSVDVARGDFATAWQIARARGLPRQSTARPGLFAGRAQGRAEAARSEQIAQLLRADPGVADARVVLGRRGAAVSVRASDPARVDSLAIERRVRAVAGFGAADPVAVDVHALAEPPPAPEATGHPTLSLWFATSAVVLMLIGCGLVWRRIAARVSVGGG